MLRRGLQVTAIAVLAAACCTPARADDTTKLFFNKGAAPTATASFGGGVDDVPVHFYRHSYYRPYYYPHAFAYYPRTYAFSYGYVPSYSYYYPPAVVYSPPPVVYSVPAPVYVAPPPPVGFSLALPRIGLSVNVAPRSLAAVAPRSLTLPPPPASDLPPPRPVPTPGAQGGTFDYDGGPRFPVPLPSADPAPAGVPTRALPPDGRLISAPAKAPKYTYAAYGDETKRAPVKNDDRTLLIKNDKKKNDR